MNTDNIIIHKSFDMGLAPYRLVGFWSAPSINDNGYQNAMDNRPNECNCMCNHCGTGIVHHYIIKDAKGDKFSVGSSCINKLNDTLLIAQVKADKLARDKVIRREKVQAKRKKAQEDADYQREAERMVNGGLTDLEVKQKAILDAETIRFAPIVFILKPLAELLADGEQGFCDDISKEMLAGNLPKGRAKEIMVEILAKQAGRTNSKAYYDRYDEVWGILSKAEKIVL